MDETSVHARTRASHRRDFIARYLGLTVAGQLVWEGLQLPLYGLWSEASPGAMAFAVLHCTLGDVAIAAASLALAAVLLGDSRWPEDYRSYRRVAVATVVFGVAYTVFSEWINVSGRGNWTYSPLMPTLPVLGTGLSPLAQWLLVPWGVFFLARRGMRIHFQPGGG